MTVLPDEVKLERTRGSYFVIAALCALFFTLIYVIKSDNNQRQEFADECTARLNGLVVKIDGRRACVDSTHIYESEKDHDHDHRH